VLVSLWTILKKTDPVSYILVAKANLLCRLYCVRAVLDHMVERRMGKIIIITTDAGRWPTPVEALAGATGAGIVMATKVLAQELARWQIRVNTISLPQLKIRQALSTSFKVHLRWRMYLRRVWQNNLFR